jgi:16S rRNA (guanine966-N2)-methyltransferase
LKPVRDLELRPTSDRLRETLFNILGDAVADSIFVDCYAGTGAVGIEALSRGARQVIFIEKHGATAGLIRANLLALDVNMSAARGAASEVELTNTDARRGLTQLSERGVHADFIFMDPPYADIRQCLKLMERVGEQKFAEGLLGPGGRLILEHAAWDKVPEDVGVVHRTRILKQGDSALSFFGWRENSGEVAPVESL